MFEDLPDGGLHDAAFTVAMRDALEELLGASSTKNQRKLDKALARYSGTQSQAYEVVTLRLGLVQAAARTWARSVNRLDQLNREMNSARWEQFEAVASQVWPRAFVKGFPQFGLDADVLTGLVSANRLSHSLSQQVSDLVSRSIRPVVERAERGATMTDLRAVERALATAGELEAELQRLEILVRSNPELDRLHGTCQVQSAGLVEGIEALRPHFFAADLPYEPIIG